MNAALLETSSHMARSQSLSRATSGAWMCSWSRARLGLVFTAWSGSGTVSGSWPRTGFGKRFGSDSASRTGSWSGSWSRSV